MSATLQEACYENTTAVYMALELSNKQWKVLIGDGHHHLCVPKIRNTVISKRSWYLCSCGQPLVGVEKAA